MRTLCLSIFAAAVALADTYPRQPGVDALHYTFRIVVNESSPEIIGETTADIRFVNEGVRSFSLDLANSMTVSEVTPAASFQHERDQLIVHLADAPAAGDRRKFTIRYRGTPSAGLYVSKNTHGALGIFSANWPNLAHHWLPLIDHPYDKATSEFIVTAPSRNQVVANGVLVETRDLGDGRRLTHWKQSQPIASWLNALGIAEMAVRNFATARGIPLQTWVPYPERDAAIAGFEKPVRQAIEFFSDYVGTYPYDKLANIWAWSPGFSGGTEHAGAIFYSCCKVSPQLVWHEIAHQWFGDAVTERDWDDVWLAEGFATYFTHLTREHYEGRDAFLAGLRTDRPRIFAAEKNNPGEPVIHNNLADMKKVLFPGQVVYQKGGWVLHMLRGQIGADAFQTGIREYYRLYRDSNASTSDLQRIMEEASGQRLGWFFDQWLHRSGSPALKGAWKYDAAAKQLVIEISQNQASDVYRLPLEISVDGKLTRIEMTSRQQSFAVPADKAPADVVLDPNIAILMDALFEARK